MLGQDAVIYIIRLSRGFVEGRWTASGKCSGGAPWLVSTPCPHSWGWGRGAGDTPDPRQHLLHHVCDLVLECHCEPFSRPAARRRGNLRAIFNPLYPQSWGIEKREPRDTLGLPAASCCTVSVTLCPSVIASHSPNLRREGATVSALSSTPFARPSARRCEFQTRPWRNPHPCQGQIPNPLPSGPASGPVQRHPSALKDVAGYRPSGPLRESGVDPHTPRQLS